MEEFTGNNLVILDTLITKIIMLGHYDIIILPLIAFRV